MDAPTISAFAAAGAALAAASVAVIQFYVGHRQSKAAMRSADAALMNAQNAGRHTVAEFRQKWIDKVIDALCEHHAILMATTDARLAAQDDRKRAALRTKLEILLNPDEATTVALLKLMDDIPQSASAGERDAKAREMVQVARKLLKTEWVRIKAELQ